MNHIEKIDKFKLDIEKIKAEFLSIFYEIKNWSKDDPDLYDFNAICVNQKPNDPKSIIGGNIRGLYWTYPKEDWNEEQRLAPIIEKETSCSVVGIIGKILILYRFSPDKGDESIKI